MDSGSVRVYDIKSKELQQHYVLHEDTTSVCWHPTGNYMISSGTEGKINITDVMEGRPLYTISGHEGGIRTIQFSTTGDKFASGGSDGHVMVWSANLL